MELHNLSGNVEISAPYVYIKYDYLTNSLGKASISDLKMKEIKYFYEQQIATGNTAYFLFTFGTGVNPRVMGTLKKHAYQPTA